MTLMLFEADHNKLSSTEAVKPFILPPLSNPSVSNENKHSKQENPVSSFLQRVCVQGRLQEPSYSLRDHM